MSAFALQTLQPTALKLDMIGTHEQNSDLQEADQPKQVCLWLQFNSLGMRKKQQEEGAANVSHMKLCPVLQPEYPFPLVFPAGMAAGLQSTACKNHVHSS